MQKGHKIKNVTLVKATTPLRPSNNRYSRTSIQRWTKGLANCVRFNGVSLYRGSFSYISPRRKSFVLLRSSLYRAFKSVCLRDRGRLGNRGRRIWLIFDTLSCYGVLCNMPKFQLHCFYLGWVLDITLFGVPQCFFKAHFGHFSILWWQC